MAKKKSTHPEPRKLEFDPAAPPAWEDSSPDVPNQQPAAITAKNIDPAWIYEIDAGPDVTHKGIVANFTHDPITKQWIAPDQERRRFLVLDADPQHVIELGAALEMNLRRLDRRGPAEQAALEHYMSIHYTTQA